MTDLMRDTGERGPETGHDDSVTPSPDSLTSPVTATGDVSFRTKEYLDQFGEAILPILHKMGASSHDPNEAITQIAAQEIGKPEKQLDTLYDHQPGTLTQEKVKELKGGVVNIGSYYSPRASHRTGIYVPEGYDPAAKWPVVLMSFPLGTSAKGHNQEVARQMMEKGFVVIAKGTPRYYNPTTKALTLAEDANEMLGLLKAVSDSGIVGEIEEIIGYGESQAAMKLLTMLGMKDQHGINMVDSLQVAACFFREINLKRPDKQLARLGGMVLSTARFLLGTTTEDRDTLKGTFNIKDLHHHLAVIRVLISGELGQNLDHIPKGEHFRNRFFGKDGNSKPQRSSAEISTRFPNAEIEIDHKYGHVDGIMSWETRVHRELMLLQVAKWFDMKSVVALENVDKPEAELLILPTYHGWLNGDQPAQQAA